MSEPPSLDWTVEQAIAATEHALRLDSSRSHADPTLPIYQWNALQRIESDRKAFEESGDGYYVLRALRVCCNHDVVAPPWLARAFIRAFDAVNKARVGSWEEVFGKPYPKGTHLGAIRRRMLTALPVYNRVRILVGQGAKIDDGLFEAVGAEFDIGKTKASEYYYHWLKRLSPPNR